MARGTPDDGQSLSSSLATQTFDPGEDTNRLLMAGGANSRSGRWLWASGFESDEVGAGSKNLNLFMNGAGSVSVVTMAQAVSGTLDNSIWQGNHCLQISTGALNNDNSYPYKILPWSNGKLGIELMFTFPFAPTPDLEFQMEISHFGYTTGHYSQARLILVLGAAGVANLYRDNNGARVLLQNVAGYFDTTRGPWHFIKLVFDPLQNLYSRVLFDNLVFQFPTATPGFIGAAAGFYDRFLFGLATKSANARSIWIDNLILTSDEP